MGNAIAYQNNRCFRRLEHNSPGGGRDEGAAYDTDDTGDDVESILGRKEVIMVTVTSERK